ncbi:MAG: hypothetical protein ABSE46_04575 [Terracidiphilus sp.]|jgi:hypothetical protein
MLLILAAAPLLAQAPTPLVHSSDLGFTYAIPSDWQVVDASATLPTVQQQVTQNAAGDDTKKGIACVQVALTARHGDPASVIVVLALPYACFQQEMTDKDLPGFATGASEGLKQILDITDAVTASYALGSHNIWIERAKGTAKANPELHFSVETACTLLKKAAVCWMTTASDDAAMQTFEHGAVTLDQEAPAVLVPPTAFDKKAP